jgi:hypothetical protein
MRVASGNSNKEETTFIVRVTPGSAWNWRVDILDKNTRTCLASEYWDFPWMRYVTIRKAIKTARKERRKNTTASREWEV